ncbi:MAG: hypothetical protein PWP49_637, partial [Thermococcaceae archaeon]|nr:hypothetical protein [Thermococcaceae archaeon]
ASPQGSIIRDYLKITENKRIQKFHLSLPMKQPMRITEIKEELGISERSVREHVLNLYKRGVLRRELIQRGWRGYVYSAVSPAELLARLRENVVKKINEIEKELKNDNTQRP